MPKKSASKKNLKLGLAVLGLVLAFIILGQFINFYKTLTSPINSFSEKKYSWTNKFNINIVIQSDETALLNFNPQEEKISLMSIPKEAYLDVSGGYGQWMLGSIFELGESSEKGLGQTLIKNSLFSLLGIPIDGFIKLPEGEEMDIKSFLELLRQNPISGIQLFFKATSDMTPLELINLKFGLMKVRFDKINYIDLSSKTFDPVKLDSILTDFEDPKIRNENLSIAVFNATNYPQLAQKAKRIITNLGGNVIIISNYPKEIKNTVILGEESDSLERLKQIFLTCLTKECDKMSPVEISSNEASSRAQINIFLGEDFAQAF